MNDLSKQAEPAIGELLKADEYQLYEQLAMRVKGIEKAPEHAGDFAMKVTYQSAEMGLRDDVIELGERIFRRWNTAAYELVCGSEDADSEDRKKIAEAIGLGETAVAAALSGLLVSSFGLAPAIAAVVAALVIKRFGRPVYEELCKVWKRSIDE